METLELAIYMLIAVLTAALVLKVFIITNFEQTTGKVDSQIKNKELPKFTMAKDDFIPQLIEFWQECGLGSVNASKMTYIKGNESITRQDIIGYITKFNKGNLMKEEDLNSSDISLPAIVEIRCMNGKLILTKG